MAFGFLCWGFDVWYLVFGLRASDFGLRDSDFGFKVSGFGFRVSGFGIRVSGSRFRASEPERGQGVARPIPAGDFCSEV